ncbi:RNA-guided endonuclease InsQ/TnpB family protein [Sulfolobus acidocaldarius]|uniref:RNA-guided endonuclease InsQ/TnpB family protein n=1 Tax=Sulfolobus acidocaldarius TaxID=2285 RepID=UPI0007804285|nr:IS200/IS605 family accessory protein TnpB-related protein [Sulfolobus acidocaldarius]
MLSLKVNSEVYTRLKEVEEEYKQILEDAIDYGLRNNIKSFTRLKAGIYRQERARHPSLPSHYIYTACEDASARLKSFMRRKKEGKTYTDKPELRNVTVHLDDHLWRFSLGEVRIATRKGWVSLKPFFTKLFWKYYNKGWALASESSFKLCKGNVVKLYPVFKKPLPKPYDVKGFIPVDLNEDNVSLLLDGKPLLVETSVKKITLGYAYKRKRISEGRSTKDRDVKRALKSLKERFKKLDIRRKLAKLIVTEALREGKGIVLEDLPKNTPEKMVQDIKDKQLRDRIYKSAFASLKNAIVEKAKEFGVPVLLVNPAYTSSVCPIHECKIIYPPDGSSAPRVGVNPAYTSSVCPIHECKIIYPPDGSSAPRVGMCEKGREEWHRDVVALYNLLKKAGYVSPMPLGSKESHDPLTVRLGEWLRAKSLHLTLNVM